MTFGEQTNETVAHEIMDAFIKEGGNFIDTAEQYSAPNKAETAGKSEEIIGNWLKKQKDRSKIIISSKVAGYSDKKWLLKNRIPEGKGDFTRLDFDSVVSACEGSLKRLQTDYIDIYIIHYPDRYVPGIGENGYNVSKERKDNIPIEETLRGIKHLLEVGKIKSYGVSNETCWGLAMYHQAALKLGIPLPCMIQNSYSLLHRSFESELTEVCRPINMNVGLVAWSPLAGGQLTGKYLTKEGDLSSSRFEKFADIKWQSRFSSQATLTAASKYADVAKKYDLTCTELALSFCASRVFMTSILFGCTSVTQLHQNILAMRKDISKECVMDVNKVYLEIRDPGLDSW